MRTNFIFECEHFLVCRLERRVGNSGCGGGDRDCYGAAAVTAVVVAVVAIAANVASSSGGPLQSSPSLPPRPSLLATSASASASVLSASVSSSTGCEPSAMASTSTRCVCESLASVVICWVVCDVGARVHRRLDRHLVGVSVGVVVLVAILVGIGILFADMSVGVGVVIGVLGRALCRQRCRCLGCRHLCERRLVAAFLVSVCTRVAGVRQQRRVEHVAANGRVRDHMYTSLRKYLLAIAQRMQVCQL